MSHAAVSRNLRAVQGQNTAESVCGVTSVDNQLATTAEVAADKSDAAISRKVKFALFFHRNVSLGKTTVEVKDGIVTLGGDASSQAQKELDAYRARMYDLSEFMKTIKQRFTVFYNANNKHQGPAWWGRYKSVLVQDNAQVQQLIAACL